MTVHGEDTFNRIFRRYRWSFALAALGTGLWMPLNAVFLVDERGLDATRLAGYYFAVAAAAIAVNLIFAPRMDGPRVLRLFLLAGVLQMLGIVGVLVSTRVSAILLAGMISGAGNGLFFAAQGIVLLRIFGADRLSTVYGRQYRMVNLFIGIGAVTLALLVQTASFVGYAIGFSVNAASYLIHVLNVAGPVRRVAGATFDSPSPAEATATLAGGRFAPYRDRRFGSLLIVQCALVAFGIAQLDSTAPVLFREAAGLPIWAVTMLMVVNTVAVVCVQGAVTKRVPLVGSVPAIRRAMIWWVAAFIPAAIVTVVTTSAWIGVLALVLYGAVFGVAETWVSPAVSPLAVELAPADRVGSYSAAASLMYSLGMLIGPPLALFVYAHLDAIGYWVFLLVGFGGGAVALHRLGAQVTRPAVARPTVVAARPRAAG